MAKNGVNITKLKQMIKDMLPEPYHAIAFSFLDKIKKQDKIIHIAFEKVQKLESFTEVFENGKQNFIRKHPDIEVYENQIKLFNATVKELMNYIRSSLMIQNKNAATEDEFKKQMEEFDADFRK